MKKIYLSILFGCFACLLMAQRNGGLLVSDERYQQIPILPLYSGAKYTEIPIKVSLKKYCPVPGNQQQSGSCVGWAVGYGALTIQRAIQSNATEQSMITKNANSAAFLYNQIRQNTTDCTEGAYLEDGLQLVKQQGDCLENSFNFEQFDCHSQPAATHLNEAQRYRVRDFAAVFTLQEEAKSKIGKACKILATNTPLIVGMGVTNSFFELLPGAAVWNPTENEVVSQHHAMVLVGYNSVEKYFELLNSFGPSWGQNGFVRLSFDDFERLCRYAYVIVPDAAANMDAPVAANITNYEPPITANLSGEFVFRQPAGFVTNELGDELMYFEEIRTQERSTGIYVTETTKFKVGDVFQLMARDIPRGRFVYVFSQSADGTLNAHFPRKKETYATAGFVLEKTVEIVIPSEETLLQLPMPGEDNLCIVYSHAPIPAYEQRLEALRENGQPFVEKVRDAFQDVLIEAPNVQFSADKMAFSAITDPQAGKIAALIVLSVYAE